MEPAARGLASASAWSRSASASRAPAGYRKIVLWTQSILDPARHIYAKAGFTLVGQEPNEEFGKGLVSETWEWL